MNSTNRVAHAHAIIQGRIAAVVASLPAAERDKKQLPDVSIAVPVDVLVTARDALEEQMPCDAFGLPTVLSTPPADDVREALAGVALIAAERHRQVTEEGYTPEHDRDHAYELTWAARCYAENVALNLGNGPTWEPGANWHTVPDFQDFPWPWHKDFWKPTGDPVRDLVKAGALIAAAIDSLTETRACTCPSGDGPLRWPCPAHPPTEVRPRGTVAPPADDVSEAAEAAAEAKYPMGVSTMGWSYEDAAEYNGRHEGFIEGFLAAAGVRPRGTATPPADDVREALALAIQKAEDAGLGANGWSRRPGPGQLRAADAILAAFEVCPHGTVTDTERYAKPVMIPDAPYGEHQVVQPTSLDAAYGRCRCFCGHVETGADCWEARAKVREHVRTYSSERESDA